MRFGGITFPKCWNFVTLSSSFFAKKTTNSHSCIYIIIQQCLLSGGSESNGFHRVRVSSNTKLHEQRQTSFSCFFCQKIKFAFVFAFDILGETPMMV